MATYNKRGYKAPKPAEVNEVEPVEEVIDDSNSTTAGVFNSLDEGASKTEEWVAGNQKLIYIILAIVTIGTIGYLGYNKWIATPAEETAATDMFQAQQYFIQAVDATEKQDSLFNLALKGGEGKQGLLDIIENHKGTDAANLAEYSAGMAYLNLGKYKDAVGHLENFKTDNEELKALAFGAIGDAFAQLKQNNEALEYYDKAVKAIDNDLITPRFLFKSAQLSLAMNKKEDALKNFTQIKEKYETSAEGANIDAYIARTE
ncbi:MAG: tetratricopeptide repeat protein [Flavobacterium sp.]